MGIAVKVRHYMWGDDKFDHMLKRVRSSLFVLTDVYFNMFKPLDCSMWLFSYTVAMFFGGFATVGDVVMFWNHTQ